MRSPSSCGASVPWMTRHTPLTRFLGGLTAATFAAGLALAAPVANAHDGGDDGGHGGGHDHGDHDHGDHGAPPSRIDLPERVPARGHRDRAGTTPPTSVRWPTATSTPSTCAAARAR